jgi:hypothetical protein
LEKRKKCRRSDKIRISSISAVSPDFRVELIEIPKQHLPMNSSTWNDDLFMTCSVAFVAQLICPWRIPGPVNADVPEWSDQIRANHSGGILSLPQRIRFALRRFPNGVLENVPRGTFTRSRFALADQVKEVVVRWWKMDISKRLP